MVIGPVIPQNKPNPCCAPLILVCGLSNAKKNYMVENLSSWRHQKSCKAVQETKLIRVCYNILSRVCVEVQGVDINRQWCSQWSFQHSVKRVNVPSSLAERDRFLFSDGADSTTPTSSHSGGKRDWFWRARRFTKDIIETCQCRE